MWKKKSDLQVQSSSPYYQQNRIDLKSKIEILHYELGVSIIPICKRVDKFMKFFQLSYLWPPQIQSYIECVEYWRHIETKIKCPHE